jgi:hypothetical protein
MRLTILALFLSTGTAAFCQWAAPAPLQQKQPWVLPPSAAPLDRDLSKLPPGFHFTLVPQQTLILPRTMEIPRKEGAQIDPKFVVHPPKPDLGEQAPGTLVAQNLYPGLQLLPIEEPKAAALPLSTTWPKLKIKDIPIVWPKFDLKAIGGGASAQPSGK